MTVGRKPADPKARLKILRSARASAKNSDVLGADDMAAAVAMTWRGLKKSIDADPDFPIQRRGGEGVPYQFSAIAALDHMIARCEAAVAERRARQDKVDRLSGAPRDEAVEPAKIDDDTPLSVSELRSLGEAQMTAHKLKLLQNRYVDRDKNAAVLADYHSHLQSNVLGLVGKVDPAGQWPAAVRLAVEDGMRNLLVELQALMTRHLESQRVATPT
jgi:hypothetical protein